MTVALTVVPLISNRARPEYLDDDVIFIITCKILYHRIESRHINGFERRKEQSKERIRRAALELFELYGFEQVTITYIARKADVSQVTIYNHFGSKEELVCEVIRMLIHNLLEKQRTIIKGEGTFAEKLELIIFDRIEMLNQYKGELLHIIFKCDPRIQQMVGYLLQQELDHLAIELFNEGKRDGYIKPELSDEAIMAYYEVLRRGIIASSRLVDANQNIKLVHELTKLFLHGLMENKEQQKRCSFSPAGI